MIARESLHTILYVDLSTRRFWTRQRPELFHRFLGGTGVATALLAEECPQDADPYGPENPIIFAVGPLTSLFPLASKTVAMFKSPHTGNLGESHAGGRSAIALRMAGFGAIVIRGKSETPVYLSIHDGKVFFRDATTLWGMHSNFTVGRIIREREPGSGHRSIMRIGKAGENLVSYACVTTETYRHFGRLGLGAVFGSKMLKAIAISGKTSIEIPDKKAYRELYDQLYQTAVKSPVMKKYHDLGTASNILPLNQFGGLPTRNLQSIRIEEPEKISGEHFAENYLGRRLACAHCPVGCIHIAALREPYDDEPYFYKTSMISYDYEPIFALGSMLGGTDSAGLLKLMDAVEVFGLDCMSAGVVLAWATEAFEKGLITSKETLGLTFAWNDYPTYITAIRHITEQPNDFYRILAKGVIAAADVYGGKEFAMAFGTNEMPGYHTGPAAPVGFAVGTRHSHLDNAGYSFDQKMLINDELSPRDLAAKLIEEEKWRQVLSSLVVCFFARGLYTPQLVQKSLAIAGYERSLDAINAIGSEIYLAKYRFKFREGFSLENSFLPERMYQTQPPMLAVKPDYVTATIAAVNDIIQQELHQLDS
jgi:aldehyde:ferredoxin oxidoreductase